MLLCICSNIKSYNYLPLLCDYVIPFIWAQMVHVCIVYIFKEHLKLLSHLIFIICYNFCLFFWSFMLKLHHFEKCHFTEYGPYLVKHLIQVTWMELLLPDLIKWNVVIYIYRTKHFFETKYEYIWRHIHVTLYSFKVLNYIHYSHSLYV